MHKLTQKTAQTWFGVHKVAAQSTPMGVKPPGVLCMHWVKFVQNAFKFVQIKFVQSPTERIGKEPPP